MANSTTTSEQMRENAGDEISVTLGGLEWTPTYLSTDNNGNVILTLWLTNSSQLSGKNITSSTTFDAYGASTWSSGWEKNNPNETYPSHMYGTSYIRSVTLNNGGKYATSGTEDTTANQDTASVFAKFTMKSVSDLPDYIVTPYNVQWQEYGQNYNEQFGMGFSYSCPNENWSDQIPNKGTYEGTTYYRFDSYNDAYYNYAGKGADNYAWRDDKIWLPSLTETGYSDTKIGLWNTSTTQRQNSTYSWLRSGCSSYAYTAYILPASGSAYYDFYVNYPHGVRPALHLNLYAAAKSAGIDVPEPTWIDIPADKFANEDEADGSESQPYEISNAEELARLAYVVNNDLSNSNGVKYNTLHYKQTADIQLGQYNWVPIGQDNSHKFMGSYDGAGYNIDGMYIIDAIPTPENDAIGLFGYVGYYDNYTLIENVIVRSGHITSTQNKTYVGCDYGGIVGHLAGGEINNCKNFVNIDVKNDTNGGVGGIVGVYVGHYSIKNCINYGNISADCSAGGIANLCASDYDFDDPDLICAEMSFCTNYGNIYSKSSAGGICNSAPLTYISNCTVYGEISGEDKIGGLVAVCDDGYSSYYNINCSVYATIIATETSQNVGAFVGLCYPSPGIQNCVFIGTIKNATPVMTGGEYEYGVSYGCTSCYAIINGEKYYTDGDFSGWAMSDKFNSGYPVQRDMYWSMQFAPEFDINYFDGWNKLTQ